MARRSHGDDVPANPVVVVMGRDIHGEVQADGIASAEACGVWLRRGERHVGHGGRNPKTSPLEEGMMEGIRRSRHRRGALMEPWTITAVSHR